MNDRSRLLATLAALVLLGHATMAAAPPPASAGTPAAALDAFGRPIRTVAPDGSWQPASPGAPPPSGGTQVAAGGLFHPYVTYPLANGAGAVAIGDVTGDGRNDVVAVQPYVDSVCVFVQNAAGALNPAVRYPASITYFGPFEGSVSIADMNHDGRLDAVVGLDNAVGVMLQTGGGLLSPPAAYPTVHSSFSNVYKIRTGDFNHDGLADVASIDWGTQSNDVDVFLQKPDGSLAASSVHPVLHDGYDDLEAGDVNGDGLTDIVVMSGQAYAYDNLGILTQAGNGGFNSPAYYDLGGNELTSGVGIGDVNHDGRNDVVVSYGGNGPSAMIGVFLQDGSGHLAAPFSLPSYDLPGALDVGDLNLDGRDDVITLHNGWLALGVYLQGGGGTLQPEDLYPVPYSSSDNPHALAIGDLNGDFLPDIAIADASFGLTVLYNAGSLPTPVQTSLVRADAFLDRIELEWETNAGPGSATTVERSDAPGAWREVGTATVGAAQRVAFVDHDVASGARYGYRLGHDDGGRQVFAGEVWVDVPGSRPLALRGSDSNPSGGHVIVTFTLPLAQTASLELMDLSGRRVASREVGSLGVGEHRVDMTPERPLIAGVYWLRLTQGNERRIAKVAILR